MNLEKQKRAPVYEALERLRRQRVVPFDVPGHKRGRGNPELVRLLGEQCVGIDVNSMKPLDNLCHPVSVILEAEDLAADAFGAAHAFFMVGGTTSAVQSMILSACKAGQKLIVPRNVHKSVINALVLCGAVPVYVNPDVEPRIGISLGMELSQVEQAIRENPDAVAVLVNNPTYYGICSDIRGIVKTAHEHGMMVLADEAHGTHFYFNSDLPVSAMEAGADMAAVSMHKSGGSLTQSSLLLLNKGVNEGYVRQIINLTQTTSASYLLISSLDISRRNLALRGSESFAKVMQIAEYARSEINEIGGYYAYSSELCNGTSCMGYDVTKLSVYTRDIGLAGIEVMISCGMNTISRSSSAISAISSRISPSATGCRISSVWSAHSPISSVSIPAIRPVCSVRSISRRRLSQRRRRHSMPTRKCSRWSRQAAESARNSSCATRRVSRFWLPVRLSRRKSSIISAMPRKKAAPCRVPKTRRSNISTY